VALPFLVGVELGLVVVVVSRTVKEDDEVDVTVLLEALVEVPVPVVVLLVRLVLRKTKMKMKHIVSKQRNSGGHERKRREDQGEGRMVPGFTEPHTEQVGGE